MTVLRWVFTDPTDSSTYTVTYNPNAMTSPFPPKPVIPGVQSPVTGQYRTGMTPVVPVEWTFSGRIYDSAHHDALKSWTERPHVVHVTDHYGRTFEVLFTQFAPKERYPTHTNYDRYDYEVKALVFGQI